MTLEVYFRDQLMGVGTVEDGRTRWDKVQPGLEEVVGFYRNRGFEGEDLLRRLLERLQGNWVAREAGGGEGEMELPALLEEL